MVTTSKNRTSKTKFLSRTEVKAFLNRLNKIGIAEKGIYYSLEVETTHYQTGEEEVKCRFYLDWHNVFPTITTGEGSWWSPYFNSLMDLFEAIVDKKDAMREVAGYKE